MPQRPLGNIAEAAPRGIVLTRAAVDMAQASSDLETVSQLDSDKSQRSVVGGGQVRGVREGELAMQVGFRRKKEERASLSGSPLSRVGTSKRSAEA